MFGVEDTGSALDTTAHIIQVALTPVFLLSGIATLLNVFSTRLARVADRVEAVSKALDGADAAQAKAISVQLVHLHRRSLALDVAVVLGAIGGAATCAAVLALFVGALREATIASVLFALFGLAVACALGAIVAFTAEMLMAGTGIRAEVAQSRRSASQDAAVEAQEPQPDAGDARETPVPSDRRRSETAIWSGEPSVHPEMNRTAQLGIGPRSLARPSSCKRYPEIVAERLLPLGVMATARQHG